METIDTVTSETITILNTDTTIETRSWFTRISFLFIIYL